MTTNIQLLPSQPRWLLLLAPSPAQRHVPFAALNGLAGMREEDGDKKTGGGDEDGRRTARNRARNRPPGGEGSAEEERVRLVGGGGVMVLIVMEMAMMCLRGSRTSLRDGKEGGGMTITD